MDSIGIIFIFLILAVVFIVCFVNRREKDTRATQNEYHPLNDFIDRENEEFQRFQNLKKQMISNTVAAFSNIGWTEWDESIHCSDEQVTRMRRAVEENAFDLVCYNPNTQNAKIRSKSGKCYLTSSHRCSCPDFRDRRLPCKHMYFLSYVIPDYKDRFPNMKKGNSLKGLNFCICGRGQDAVKEYISAHGGEIGNIFIRETSAVVLASQIESSVVATAKEYNMEILTFEELKTLFPDCQQTQQKNEYAEFAENKTVEEETKKYDTTDNNKIFEDMTFVLTGTFNTMSKDEISECIQNAGGKVSGSVSKKTTFLIAGEDCGIKLEKAKELGVPIISEDEFFKMLDK